MKNKGNKLSLDQFKAKANGSEGSLEFVSGGILGACHDRPRQHVNCTVYRHMH